MCVSIDSNAQQHNLRLIVSSFLDIFFYLDIGIDTVIASLHTTRSTALAQLLELLQTRRRRVLIAPFGHNGSSNLGPFPGLELLLEFLLCLEESVNLYNQREKNMSEDAFD